MKPSDILFYKKHLGTSKFCTKNEQKATKIMTILSRDFVTERIAPAFIMLPMFVLLPISVTLLADLT